MKNDFTNKINNNIYIKGFLEVAINIGRFEEIEKKGRETRENKLE